MIKKVYILYFLILGFNTKAQNWTPLDTGIHYYVPYGLLADNGRGNLFAFGYNAQNGVPVWTKNKWETWYSDRNWGTFGDELTFYNNKITFFHPFLENNDNSKPRTAILQFTDSTDLDTLKVLQNQDWLPMSCTYNGKLLLHATTALGVNSIATFDGDTIIPFGTPAIHGINAACVYKGELYCVGFLMDGYRGIIKLTSTGWQKVYQVQGSFSFIINMIEYNKRLYIYGGIFLEESPTNIGHSIIAYDGVKFDSIDGGVRNASGFTPANVNDAVICGGKLYVTGGFLLAGNKPARGVAYWNDTTWCSVYKDLDSTGNFFRVENFNDTLYEVAQFHKINGSDYGWIAKLNNMSLADTCTEPRYPKPVRYNFENLGCLPNPFTDNVTVQIPSNYILSETKLVITDNLGQSLLNLDPDSYNQLLNLSFLSSQMYFLTVQDNSNRKTVKIIKQ